MNDSLGSFNLILLALPALALRIAVPALYGRKRLSADDPMHVLLTMSSTIMFVLAGTGLVTGMTGFWFQLPLLVAILIYIGIIIGLIVLILMVVDRTRLGQHRALLGSLSAAAQHGIPLPEAARAYADEALGDAGMRSLTLAESLEQGAPLSAAARKARLKMGTGIRLAVRLGERLDQLGPALRGQLDDWQQSDVALRNIISRLFYLGAIVIVMCILCTFMMLRIVPVFQKMFEEFGLKLPALTQLVVNISRWFVTFGWVPTLPLILLLSFGFVIVAVLYYVGRFPRNLPFVWRLFKRYDGALVMRALALTTRRAIPLPDALRLVAERYPLSIIAGRLREAANRVEAGMPWCDSLRRIGLIADVDAAVLSAAQRAGNLDWALDEMSSRAIRRQIYQIQAIVQFVFPALLLPVALFVFVFVCGLFMPLISLIQGLT